MLPRLLLFMLESKSTIMYDLRRISRPHRDGQCELGLLAVDSRLVKIEKAMY